MDATVRDPIQDPVACHSLRESFVVQDKPHVPLRLVCCVARRKVVAYHSDEASTAA
jgi:hypothetical protein